MKGRISKKWLDLASEDQRVAELIWQSGAELWRALCFHAQQFVEKILKGILEGSGQRVPKIHDLKNLLDRCGQAAEGFPLEEREVLFLSSVYIDWRYPTDVGLLPGGEPTREDAEMAIRAIRKVKKWAEDM